MTELEFAERLKKYRTQRNMTQQELADKLGVSNKSVSRWETGGYPDIATLGPLARALGVTVDDLLNEQAPIRTLDKWDWQNVLSFAFAIGGGVLFFLLELFTPVLVCYLLYLGAMAYGIYLQRHYTYHSQWFYLANGIMNFFVNLKVLTGLLGLMGAPFLLSVQLISFIQSGHLSLLLPSLIYLLAGGGMTAVTQFIIFRKDGAGIPLTLQAHRTPMTARKAVPLLFLLLLTLYWCLFALPVTLPRWCYESQQSLYDGLVAIFALCCVPFFLRKGHRGMLVPSLAAILCAQGLSGLLVYPRAYSALTRSVIENSPGISHHLPIVFGQPSWLLPIAALALAAAYLVCCHVRLTLTRKTTAE